MIALLAIATRFFQLGYGSIIRDEMWTALYYKERVSSLTGFLYYNILNQFVDILGESRWSLRLPAAVLGVVGIVLVYVVTARAFGAMVAFIVGLILIFNPWHLYYSQNARFYTGLLIFCFLGQMCYYYAFLRQKNIALLASVIFAGIGFLFHPTAVFSVVPCFLFSVYVLFVAKSKEYRDVAVKYIVVCLVASVLVIPVLLNIVEVWRIEYSRVGTEGVFHYKSILAAVGEAGRLAYRVFDKMGLLLSICSLLGLWAMVVRFRERGVFLLMCAVVPVLLLLVLDQVLPAVRPRYAFFALPFFAIGASYLCYEVSVRFVDYGLMRYFLVGIVLVSLLPGFVSHYTAKQLEVEDALAIIDRYYRDGDVVMAHERDAIYAIQKGYPQWEFVKAWGERWKEEAVRATSEGHRVWFVVTSSNVPGVLKDLELWLMDHAALIWREDRKGFEYGLTGYEVWMMSSNTGLKNLL